MYKMPQYFMGYLDQNLAGTGTPRGKRFRPTIARYMFEAYKKRPHRHEKEIIDAAALAIELFHNFTLIHDDIEDNDTHRRGRPTVWKLWGVNHGINSGDALSLTVAELCAQVASMQGVGSDMALSLLKTFREVCEGQYLDFELAATKASSRKLTEKAYLTMARKKAGVLVGIAVEAGGIAAGESRTERAALNEFGTILGTFYQIADDYRSLWGKDTGKAVYGDVRERKRAYPVITALAHSGGRNRVRLAELFDMPRQLLDLEVIEAVALIDSSGAQHKTLETLRTYRDRTHAALEKLSIDVSNKKVLRAFISSLVFEV